MRQGQQNRRGRGRSSNNNGRKHQNPLTRTFESSGPDVKIRGTPSHVAEKYVALARDALSSGDPVLAENYLQHAEHYNRIIMSFREQQAQQAEQQPRTRSGEEGHARGGSAGDDGEEMSGSETRAGANGINGHDPSAASSQAGAPGEEGGDEEGSEAPAGRSSRGRSGRGRRPRGERSASRSGDEEGEQQPDFLTRPIRRQARDDSANEAAGSDAEAAAQPPVSENAD